MKVISRLHVLAALIPGKDAPDVSFIGDSVGPRADLDAVEYRPLSPLVSACLRALQHASLKPHPDYNNSCPLHLSSEPHFKIFPNQNFKLLCLPASTYHSLLDFTVPHVVGVEERGTRRFS
jgi:hypothetical protein